MKCKKCDFNGNPNLEETGPHTKATCPECGAYIKMVGRDELEAIVNPIKVSDYDYIEFVEPEEVHEVTLVIKTKAGKEYMPDILKNVSLALTRGYVCGEGTIIKPFDDEGYPYEFYYKK